MPFPASFSLSKVLFGRKPRTTLDTLIPQIDDTKLSKGLFASIGRRKQVLRRVRYVLEKRHSDKVATRQKVNTQVTSPL